MKLNALVFSIGSLCTVLMLAVSACERTDNSGASVGTTWSETNRVVVTNSDLDHAAQQTRDAAKDASRDVGRGLEKTGQAIQDAARTNQ
jgi:hypothetical protein